jgi:thiamine pyrophosphate-dependent acetolactate synthase large subunit-like protein
MMNRVELLKVLARHITDQIVVATYSTATDWLSINDRPLNYFSFGAMGLASSHGLGLALARPERRVVVLDGDGSLLMNLGTVVTIGAAAPKNLTHLVFQNDSYEANGGHPIPNRQVEFEGLARSAGIRRCTTVSDLPRFEKAVGTLLADDGPVFACLKVEQGPLSAREYADMYSQRRRDAFRAALDETASA